MESFENCIQETSTWFEFLKDIEGRTRPASLWFWRINHFPTQFPFVIFLQNKPPLMLIGIPNKSSPYIHLYKSSDNDNERK